MPTGERTFADKLLVASTIHRTLEEVARNAGQETLQRGPRGGFCNGAGTFDQLMDSLVTALDAAGCLGSVEIIIDVHASRLVARESTETVSHVAITEAVRLRNWVSRLPPAGVWLFVHMSFPVHG